jgi:hypothetical protein
MKKHESSIVTTSNEIQLQARAEIFQNFLNYKGTIEERERCIQLFTRGSLLSRNYAIRELYELIVNIPGGILDLGTWRGETMIICENLRSIFEPFNVNRRIYGFDTFEGYIGFEEAETNSKFHSNGTYGVEKDYDIYLTNLIKLHEQSNVLSISDKHQVIKGDVQVTLPKFFNENKNEFISLAFFDLNSYQPTSKAFKLVYDRLSPGGIIAFWQLTRPKEIISGEGSVYCEEILNKYPHTLHKSKFYNNLSYLIK